MSIFAHECIEFSISFADEPATKTGTEFTIEDTLQGEGLPNDSVRLIISHPFYKEAHAHAILPISGLLYIERENFEIITGYNSFEKFCL